MSDIDNALQATLTYAATLFSQGDYSSALQQYYALADRFPDSGEAWFGVACVLHTWVEFTQIDEVESAYRQAIRRGGDSLAPACFNLGNLLRDVGRYDEAETAYQAALSVNSNHPGAHFAVGQLALLRADWRAGWSNYEYRRDGNIYPSADLKRLNSFLRLGPEWTGDFNRSKSGKKIRLFVYSEQGGGDTLQFVRFVLALKQHFKVTLALPAVLLPLIASSPLFSPIHLVDLALPPPDFDAHISLMSLPLRLGVEEADLYGTVPYLMSPQKSKDYWRQALLDTHQFKVGVVWAGNLNHGNDAKRSIDFSCFMTLFQRRDITWISLQKTLRPGDAEQLSQFSGFRQYGTQLVDYADTAGLIDNLDLVISVDTSVVHLAGALGKPVWVLLPKVPDWRWQLDRDDSPWYPSALLFRQNLAGNWTDVLFRISEMIDDNNFAGGSNKVQVNNLTSNNADDLGLVFFQQGCAALSRQEWQLAESLIMDSLKLYPDVPEAYCSLAVALNAQGQFAAAESALNRAIELQDTYLEAWRNLAILLRKCRRYDESLICFKRVLTLDARDRSALKGLADCELALGSLAAAEVAYQTVLLHYPDYDDAALGYGRFLRDVGRMDEAEQVGRYIIKRNSNHAGAWFYLATLLLMRQKWLEGWSAYEYRRKISGYPVIDKRRYERLLSSAEEWNGFELGSDDFLLIYSEQGVGDTLQFMRFALALSSSIKITLALPAELLTLVAASPRFSVFRVVDLARIPLDFAQHVSMMSLPHRLSVDESSLSLLHPYLNAPASTSQRWQKVLSNCQGLKVGLVWAGNPNHSDDVTRSIPLQMFGTLLQLRQVTWVSLQKELRPGDNEWLSQYPNFLRHGEQLGDYADTAGLIANLDLVISVDTSVVHLAGAMGKPVWVLLPKVPDWRWLLDRSDTPWYPTTLLFRQASSGDWDTVLSLVEKRLMARIAKQIIVLPKLAIHEGEIPFKAVDLALNAGQLSQAVTLCDEIDCTLSRDDVQSRANLLFKRGCIDLLKRDWSAAERKFSAVLGITPSMAEAHCNLATALLRLDRLDEAEHALNQATRLRDGYVDAWRNFSLLRKRQGRHVEALNCQQRLLNIRPDDYLALKWMADTEHMLGLDEKAEKHYLQVIAARPGDNDAALNYGRLLRDLGRSTAAESCWREILTRDPGYFLARMNLSMLLLFEGRWQEGWEHYEARWQGDFMPAPNRLRRKGLLECLPEWQGDSLENKRLLVYLEQGAGDTFQFLRFIPALCARGAEVYLGVTENIRSLMVASSLCGAHHIATSHDDIDCHIPLLSLPHRLRIDSEVKLSSSSYLMAPEFSLLKWESALSDARGLKVGLVWAGNPQHSNDNNRSIDVSRLAPLFEQDTITWVSLQKEMRSGDVALLSGYSNVRLYGEQLGDFGDTAGLIANLDLVIGVDTSVMHLAGAMGKPVWIMLPKVPDWRWLQDRVDSPWYPTARLFRQDILASWDEVVKHVCIALSEFSDKCLTLPKLDAGKANALANQAFAYRQQNKHIEALACYRQLLHHWPNDSILLNELKNYSKMLKSLNLWDEAEIALRDAFSPQYKDASVGIDLAMLLLRRCSWQEGWEIYEHRWNAPGFCKNKIKNRSELLLVAPEWNGENLEDKTIFVYPEQGIGDSIQFLRFLNGLSRSAHILLSIPKSLHNLVRTSDLCGAHQLMDGIPEKFDFHVSLMSLPHKLGIVSEAELSRSPYLHAPWSSINRWKSALSAGVGPRVGLVWAGNPQHSNDINRSIDLVQLKPLFEHANITWVSLQKVLRPGDVDLLSNYANVIHFTDGLGDFADTAGLIANLDLVIGVDTSVMHLAGAMGKPAWIMLPKVPDWRWLLDREDSPWYPTARLFRQSVAGDWENTIDGVAQALVDFCLYYSKEKSTNNIGDLYALLRAGQYQELEQCANLSLAERPGDFDLLKLLGVALEKQGRAGDAVAPLLKADSVWPEQFELTEILAYTLAQAGRTQDALLRFQKLASYKPADWRYPFKIGELAGQLFKHDIAIDAFAKVSSLRPNHVRAYSERARLLAEIHRFSEAADVQNFALALDPDNTSLLTNAGTMLAKAGRYQEAEVVLRRSILLRPTHAAYLNLGHLLKKMRRLSESLAATRKSIELSSSTEYLGWRNLCFDLNYAELATDAEKLAIAKSYGVAVTANAKPYVNWNVTAQPERRMRIGFVSGDLKKHPVAFFLQGVLAELDRAEVEIFAYSNNRQEDEQTALIRQHVDHWRGGVVGLNDEKLSARIYEDQIDILLDLAGHTATSRLDMFANRPAPVQVAWLGYFATTGLTAIDWIIADSHVLPSDEAVNFVEKPWRLPDIYYCFTPPQFDLAVGALPALKNRYVTFGCFNNMPKLTDNVFAVWIRILQALPGSRLFLKNAALREPANQAHILDLFAAAGISAERIQMESSTPRKEYLESYRQVDIALDPFPFPGGTTSVEGLWMGVPVLTLRGRCFIAHQGETILTNAGLLDWIANNEEDYIARAIRHASNLIALSDLRIGLRARMLASPVFDAPRFARHLVEAWRGMWRIWCNSAEGKSHTGLSSISADDINILVKCFAENRYDAMAAHAQVLVDKFPGSGEAWKALGVGLGASGRDALPALKRAAELMSNDVDIWRNLSVAHLSAGEALASMHAAEQWIRLRPKDASAWLALGNAKSHIAKSHNAKIHRLDMHAAEAAWIEAWRLDPINLDAVRHLIERVPLDSRNRIEPAKALCNVLMENSPRPEDWLYASHVMRFMADWDAASAAEIKSLAALRSDHFQGQWPSPFQLFAVPEANSADQLRCAVGFCSRFPLVEIPLFSQVTCPPSFSGKIRLGYLSNDFHSHATTYLITEVIEHHNRQHFEVIAYDYSLSVNSSHRARILSAFDRVVLVNDLSNTALAHKIADDGIDIMIDLKCWTVGSRSDALAWRPAPLQIQWLGYPGTSGAPWLDYLIADAVLIQPGEEQFYSEKILFLPDTYQPNDRNRPIADSPTRAQVGLPENSLVLACFNQSYKITAEVFSVWMQALKRNMQAVLWLLDDNPVSSNLFRAVAERQGVDPSRVIFAPRLPLDQHLGRLQLADLALDCTPYGSHTTASDALWAGVPVVALSGKTFASRVAESLLMAVGLPELVTRNLHQYAQLIFLLAAHHSILQDYRQRLAIQRLNTPLFDSKRFVRHLEAGLLAAWQRHLDGLPPEHIRLEHTVALGKRQSKTMDAPAWVALTEKLGIQTYDNLENPRNNILQLFDHPPRRVLDIGCATGSVGKNIKDNYPDVWVWGCELNVESAEIAKSRLDRVDIIPVQDWSKDEFALLKSVDTLLLLDVLEHMYNPWAELKLLSEHLSSHAQVIVSLPNVGHVNIIRDLAHGYWNYHSTGILDITHLRFFTEYEMKRMFYQTGFRVEVLSYFLDKKLEEINEFPANVDMGNVKIVVHDKAHWVSLHAIQLGFRLKIADDTLLSAEEYDFRFGKHPKTYI